MKKSAPRRTKVLVVDDEIGIRELLSEILIDEGYAVVTAHDAASASEMRQRELPEIILLDIWMPDMDGITLMRQWSKSGYANVPIIVMSGHATIDTAVEATRMGAIEVLEKPITTTQLLKGMERARIKKGEQDSNLRLKQMDFGSTPAMRQFKKELLAAAAEPGLLTMVGALNCGADFYARYLARPNSPVVTVDNGAMLEGSLADLVARAEDGVIVVCLVNVLSSIQQNGMLGLIREANKGEARIVAVSAERPEALAERGGFNETLVGLLARRVVNVPPLAKCTADLPVIIDMICRELTKDSEMRSRALAPAAVEALADHRYEEDFAELRSVIKSMFLYSQGDRIEAETARAILRQLSTRSSMHGMFDEMYNMSLREAREYFEREYFTRLINMTNGNMQQAAKIAGLERTYFYRKLKQYKTGGGVEGD